MKQKKKQEFFKNDELKKYSFNFMNKICKIWNSQKRPPKVRFMDMRLHHYYYGVIGLFFSKVLQSSTYEEDKRFGRLLEGSSTALIIDDYRDLQKDLNKFLKTILKL